MTAFWLIRHGQTKWNLEGRIQGSRDIELNENGLAQAHRIAAQLMDVQFKAIVSSPLQRAFQTAEVVARQTGLVVSTDVRLVEISFGVWEGKLFEDIRRLYPFEIQDRKDNPLHAHPPGGETALQVSQRMTAAANEIAGLYPNGPVLLVSHGLALAALICQARSIPLENVYDMVPDNAEPVIVQWSPSKEMQDG